MASSQDYIAELEARGVSHFTTEQAIAELGRSPAATRQALGRLRKKGRIATVQRGFHVTVPPQYHSLGCRPPTHFVPKLMRHLGLDYYVGVLSAAEFHGAAHHRPQVFQVVVSEGRAPIAVGKVRVHFVCRHNAGEMPVVARNSATDVLRVSTAEATAFDLVGYPRHAAGLDNSATVLTELHEVMEAEALATVAPLSPVLWSQRLGFLLDFVGASHLTGPLADYVGRTAYRATLLAPSHRSADGPLDPRWKVHVNVEPDPDL